MFNKIVIITVLAILSLIPAYKAPIQAQAIDSAITIDVFVRDTCQHCKEEKAFLNTLENGLKRFDLGINAGGGIGINLGSIGVFGDVRYLVGVRDISDNENREIKNKGLNLSVGLMFKILGR